MSYSISAKHIFPIRLFAHIRAADYSEPRRSECVRDRCHSHFPAPAVPAHTRAPRRRTRDAVVEHTLVDFLIQNVGARHTSRCKGISRVGGREGQCEGIEAHENVPLIVLKLPRRPTWSARKPLQSGSSQTRSKKTERQKECVRMVQRIYCMENAVRMPLDPPPLLQNA